jgi:hypothetical protein
MNVVNNILQEYDPYLSFRRNVELEGSMQAIRNGVARDLGDEYKGEQGLTFAYLELGRPGKTVSVTLTWQRDLIEPKLFDLSVRDADGLVIGTLAGDPFPSVARN